MSARAWTAQDPAPTDWPVVIGPDGVVYGHDVDAEKTEDWPGLYVRQEFKHHPGGGVTYGPIALEFAEIFDHYADGATVREATEEESGAWQVTWLSGAHEQEADDVRRD